MTPRDGPNLLFASPHELWDIAAADCLQYGFVCVYRVNAMSNCHIHAARRIKLAVNGTLMTGFDLNHHLVEAGAVFVRDDRMLTRLAQTMPCYRLFTISDKHPAMVRVPHGGSSIACEVWELTTDGLVDVLQMEPPGLCIGKVNLVSGEECLGVLGEQIMCTGSKEISQWGGWRTYVASMKDAKGV